MRALERTTNLLRSATLLGALACTCTTISLPCLGQQGTTGNESTQEPQAYLWTGRKGPIGRAPRVVVQTTSYGKGGETITERVDPKAHAESLRRELAEIVLLDQVQGQRTEADARLLDLWVRAADAQDYEGRWGVLVEIAFTRAQALQRRGRLEEALLATQEILLPPSAAATLWAAPADARYELVAASQELLEAQRQAIGDGRLVALRRRLVEQTTPVEAAAPVAQDSDLERRVRDALSMSQWGLVEELGSYAVEPLAAIVAETPDELPARERDALYWLFKYGELRAARLVLDLWDRPGIYFKKRVLRGMREARVLANSGTWTFVQMPKGTMELSTQAPRMEEPVWLDVLARLLADPEVGRDSLGSVGYVAMLDGLDERLQRGLMKALEEGGPDMVKDVLAALENTQGRASVVPVLEHALEHSDPKVRVFAAERLALYPRNDALRARAGDPELLVRRAVADSVSGRVGQAAYREDGSSFWMNDGDWRIPRSVEERDLTCLTRLLQDSDAGIRQQAVQTLLEHPELEPPADLMLRLARDASPDVRARLAYWRAGRPADPALLELLATDADPEVLAFVDRRLDDLARTNHAGERVGNWIREDPGVELLWNDGYLDALLARMANPARAYEDGTIQPLVAAGRSEVGATAVVHLAATSGDPRIVAAVIDALRHDVGLPDGAARRAWARVPAEDLVAFVRAAWSLQIGGPPYRNWLRETLWGWTQDQVRPLRALLADQAAPADLRVFAGYLTAGGADAAWREHFLDAVARQGSEYVQMSADGWLQLRDLIDRMPSAEERRALFVDLVHMDDLPGWTANALIPLLWPEPWLPDELAAGVIRRFGTRTDWQWSAPLKASFQSLARGLSPEEPRLDLVQTMLEHPHLGLDTVEIVGGHPLAAYLPLLEEILLREGNTGGEASDWKVLAAKALAAYLDDRAAEILLKGLGGTTSEKVRGACFEALDTIRRYQDEKERWAQRKSSQAARDAAIAELVPMLSDEDANVRAQAARSLGALGAVEQLPALVRMLKDPVPEVRAAAQEAIDVLARPAPEGEKD